MLFGSLIDVESCVTLRGDLGAVSIGKPHVYGVNLGILAHSEVALGIDILEVGLVSGTGHQDLLAILLRAIFESAGCVQVNLVLTIERGCLIADLGHELNGHIVAVSEGLGRGGDEMQHCEIVESAAAGDLDGLRVGDYVFTGVGVVESVVVQAGGKGREELDVRRAGLEGYGHVCIGVGMGAAAI